MATAEDLVELTSEQGADVEDKWESGLEQVLRLYREILSTPGRIDDDTVTRAIISKGQRRAAIRGNEAAERYAVNVMELTDLGWDDLQDLPISTRDDVWNDAEAILSGVAMRQAVVEAGLAVDLIEGGLDAEMRAAPIAQAIGQKGLQQASKLGKTAKIKAKSKARKAEREAKRKAEEVGDDD